MSLLSGGQRQAVAIARAVKWAKHVILLDEPTASLGAKQTQVVCNLIQAVAKQGLGVLMISHDIPSVAALADRIVVMRRGAAVAEFPAKTVTLSENQSQRCLAQNRPPLARTLPTGRHDGARDHRDLLPPGSRGTRPPGPAPPAQVCRAGANHSRR